MDPIDLSEYSDEELVALLTVVTAEVQSRAVIRNAQDKADQAAWDYLRARDRHSEGLPVWVQPSSAVDAYPSGYVVSHDDRAWLSLHSANTAEPGVSGWRLTSDDPNEIFPWVQPAGAHDAYGLGDRVTHSGKVWISRRDPNSWEPGTPDSGWDEVVEDVYEEPPVDEEHVPEPEPEPDPDPEPAVLEWEPGVEVDIDELRTYGGSLYKTLQAHKTQAGWEPPIVPALFELVEE